MTERMYSIREVAELLSVADNTVRHAIEAGHLFAYRLKAKGRGTYRVPASAVAKYLEGCHYTPAPKPARKTVRGRPLKHVVLGDAR